MEELVEVTVLIEGLMPYAGYTPVMAAVWDTHAAGSMGRIGSPIELSIGLNTYLNWWFHMYSFIGIKKGNK